MLRPATPLSALFLTAFALLLLSVLSTPIIKAIPLGSFGDFNFGVFGFCKGDTCSPMEIGYDTSGLFSTIDNSSFDLPSGARKTLSAILIVHPVAAGVTLLMSILALVAHLHSPSHSSRYLLLLFIFGVLNFLVCMMAFLVDVLVFVPHMAWGAYITLAAAILVAMAMVVACAMRRTIVSRKARKRRIAENAEMSGQNYYSRQAQTTATVALGGATQPAAPSISGANGADMMPGFGSVEKDKSRSSDERIPLTAQTPSDRLPHVYGNEVVLPQTDGPYNGPGGPNGRGGEECHRGGIADEEVIQAPEEAASTDTGHHPVAGRGEEGTDHKGVVATDLRREVATDRRHHGPLLAAECGAGEGLLLAMGPLRLMSSEAHTRTTNICHHARIIRGQDKTHQGVLLL
ncbi:hypothetical protein P8C59_009305 [Phyllachora maydis]|uniref:Pali-domain-containing protein n=1 Tax=Phyllachora maydis TaxID=1825666 RepID=A0AAD9IC80_9PEZI|nr:hypothetical protein P8C59_009305 [Phyllachora maydis]